MASPRFQVMPALTIPGEIVQNIRLSAFDKYLAGLVLAYAKEGKLEVSLMQLTVACGASYPTCRNSLKKLEAEGILRYRAKEGKGGHVAIKLPSKVAAAVAAAILTFGTFAQAAANVAGGPGQVNNVRGYATSGGAAFGDFTQSMDYTTNRRRKRPGFPKNPPEPPDDPRILRMTGTYGRQPTVPDCGRLQLG